MENPAPEPARPDCMPLRRGRGQRALRPERRQRGQCCSAADRSLGEILARAPGTCRRTGSSGAIDANTAQLGDEFHTVAGLELLQDRREVFLHGVFREVQRGGNRLVLQTVQDECEDFPLPRRQADVGRRQVDLAGRRGPGRRPWMQCSRVRVEPDSAAQHRSHGRKVGFGRFALVDEPMDTARTGLQGNRRVLVRARHQHTGCRRHGQEAGDEGSRGPLGEPEIHESQQGRTLRGHDAQRAGPIEGMAGFGDRGVLA